MSPESTIVSGMPGTLIPAFIIPESRNWTGFEARAGMTAATRNNNNNIFQNNPV